jgi:hypothetical protein
MELTWETTMRLTWPFAAATSTIPLRVAPVLFGLAVSFTVAVPLAPADGLTCNHEEALLLMLHPALQVTVTVESAPGD